LIPYFKRIVILALLPLDVGQYPQLLKINELTAWKPIFIGNNAPEVPVLPPFIAVALA
jgi:hypothetical protein